MPPIEITDLVDESLEGDPLVKDLEEAVQTINQLVTWSQFQIAASLRPWMLFLSLTYQINVKRVLKMSKLYQEQKGMGISVTSTVDPGAGDGSTVNLDDIPVGTPFFLGISPGHTGDIYIQQYREEDGEMTLVSEYPIYADSRTQLISSIEFIRRQEGRKTGIDELRLRNAGGSAEVVTVYKFIVVSG